MEGAITQDAMLVLREDRGPVAWLMLNRPDRANALSCAMLAGLHAHVRAASDDAAIRAIVVTGSGKVFCAGHDLDEIRQHDDVAWQAHLFAECSALMLLIQRVGKPVIACVQGAAVAAGCQLVASCDLAYAASSARFGVSGINLGLFCGTPSVAVSRAMGRKAAMELLLTGKLIDAGRAAALGLINEVVAEGRLEATVAETAALVASKLPEAVGMGKALFYRQLDVNTEAAYGMAGQMMVENLRLDATQVCIDQFLKRQ